MVLVFAGVVRFSVSVQTSIGSRCQRQIGGECDASNV
jgi:hypothetical protein